MSSSVAALFDRLVGRELPDDFRVIGRHQRVRIGARVDEQPPAADLLVERVVDVSAGPGTMFSSSTSAATPTIRRAPVLTSMNFMTGSVHISRRLSDVAGSEHPLRDALAHDHDLLALPRDRHR